MDEQGVAAAAETEQEQAAPESEKPSKDLLEKTWDFFASVPIATVLIFIIAAASIAGSLIEQEGMYSSWKPPQDYYPERYGPVAGGFLFKTGLTRMYSSWWYLSLIYMLGASLVVCSIERFVPLWKNVQRPNPTPPSGFVKHLKNRFEYVPVQPQSPMAPLAEALKSRRYTVIEQDGRLYADKGRWGRWGPYILHIGLIMIIVGAMMRAIPNFYFDEFIWVRDSETVKVPHTDWYITSERFVAEFHENGSPKMYATDAVVIDGGKEVKRHTIIMNEPLQYRWIELYQSSYKQEIGIAQVAVTDRKSGTVLGTLAINLIQPEPSYEMAGYKLLVRDYFPDFGLDENGKPVSRSSEVKNPGLVLEITTPEGKVHTNWFFALYPEMEFDPTTPIKLVTTDLGVASTTGLKVKKDLGVPVIYLGLLIVTFGSCATFYLAHRRYWALTENGRVFVGGWTNRNHSSLRSEMEKLATMIDPKTNPVRQTPEGEEI